MGTNFLLLQLLLYGSGSEANESSVQHKDEVGLLGLKSPPYTSKQRWRSLTTEERKAAVHAAETFQPSNPFCRVILRQSYVQERCPQLHIPWRFAEKYLSRVSTKFITLEASDGKQKDKNLEEGDVCVFKLINMEDIVLKLSIFLVLEDSKMENQSSD